MNGIKNKNTNNLFSTHHGAKITVTVISVLAALYISNAIFDSSGPTKNKTATGYVTRKKKIRTLQSDDENGEYFINWNINLPGKEYLLNSQYLKAGFEQVVKDFINNDLKCEDEDDSSTSFYNVEVVNNNAKKC